MRQSRKILQDVYGWAFIRLSPLSGVLSTLALKKWMQLRSKQNFEDRTTQSETSKVMYEHRTIHKRFICGVLLIGDYVYAKDGFDYAFYRKSTNNVDDIITTFFGDDALLYDGNNMDMILREGDLLNSVISMPRQMGKTTLLREMLDDNDIQSNR